MLALYKLVAIAVHVVIIVFFESLLLTEQRKQERAEEDRLARLRALGFDPPAPKSKRIDW